MLDYLLEKPRIPLLAVALALSAHARADTEVVAGGTSSVTGLSREQVADIYLGRVGTFPNGERAIPLDQAGPSDLRDDFYLRVTGKTAAQLKAHWARMVFTGRGKPPREVAGVDEMAELLAANANMLGYMRKSEAGPGLKMLYRLPK